MCLPWQPRSRLRFVKKTFNPWHIFNVDLRFGNTKPDEKYMECSKRPVLGHLARKAAASWTEEHTEKGVSTTKGRPAYALARRNASARKRDSVLAKAGNTGGLFTQTQDMLFQHFHPRTKGGTFQHPVRFSHRQPACLPPPGQALSCR